MIKSPSLGLVPESTCIIDKRGFGWTLEIWRIIESDWKVRQHATGSFLRASNWWSSNIPWTVSSKNRMNKSYFCKSIPVEESWFHRSFRVSWNLSMVASLDNRWTSTGRFDSARYADWYCEDWLHWDLPTTRRSFLFNYHSKSSLGDEKAAVGPPFNR